MSLSTVLFFFLAHLGVGIAFTLLFVHRDAGVKFFRFNGGLAALLIGVALAFRYQAIWTSEAHATPGIGAITVGVSLSDIALFVSAVVTVFYWGTIGRVFTRARTAILVAAALTGLAAIALQGLEISSGSSSPVVALTVLSFLTSALMLGGACTAMILGHWYLVTPKLPEAPLILISRALLAVVALQVVLFAVWVSTGAGPGGGGPFTVLVGPWALFVWLRLIVGLLFPLVVSWAAVQTARTRSMESATGLLYINVGTIAAGTILAAGLYFGAGLLV